MHDEKAKVEAHVRAMFEAFANHSEDGVESAVDPDCTIWDVFLPGLIQGQAERDAFHKAAREQAMARGPLKQRVEILKTDVWGDFAVVRYLVPFEYAPPNPVSGVARVSSVMRRNDQGWRVVHQHEDMTPGGIPPIVEA